MFTIYKISNNLNGKSYIGFTSQDPPRKRWMEHQYQAKCGSKFHIHCAIRKYGIENFQWSILEEGLDPEIGKNIREPHWISALKPKYNHTDGGEGYLGGKGTPNNKFALGARYKRSEEDKLKISRRMKGNQNGLGQFGPKHSAKTREMMSIQRKGRIPWNKGIKQSEYKK